MAEKSEIDVRMILEAQGAPKEKVEEALKKLISSMEEQEKVKIYDKKFTETEERDEFFSTLADLGIRFQDFETLLSIVLNFGPSAIVVNSPERIEVQAAEIQNVVGDVSAILHTLAQDNAVLRIQNKAMFQKLQEAGLLDQQLAEKGGQQEPGATPEGKGN